jgi:CHAD domain-containing protein
MLNQEEHDLLQSYIDRSQPGMAYRKRVQILLLADNGSSAESIAAELNIPVARVRQYLRVFARERLKLFPPSMFSPPKPFTPDDPLAEAGRRVMSTLVGKAQSHEPDLRLETDVFSVHETRKTCRRLRTAFRVFEPYYDPGLLKGYGKRLRKFMRRLGRSRDLAVFLNNFDRFQEEELAAGEITDLERASMAAFGQFWRDAQTESGERVREYMARGKYQDLIQEIDEFAHSTGRIAMAGEEPYIPLKTGHIVPVILYQKAAAVRAYEGYIEGASLEMHHALRIHCKELRYTIEFFLPVLGPSAANTLAPLKQVLTHLGELNDARIALTMMEMGDDQALSPFLEIYRRKVRGDLEILLDTFSVPWSQLNQPDWRLALASAIAVL